MYGKLMSINDELMWRYWTLLTDLRQSEIDAMRADVASGALHPMEAKKRLARTIVGGFWGNEAAQQADEQWAKMFQQKSAGGDLEEVSVPFGKVYVPPVEIEEPGELEAGLTSAAIEAIGKGRYSGGGALASYSITKLIRELGLASATEAAKLIKAGAVSINNVKKTDLYYFPEPGTPGPTTTAPLRLIVRVGKRAKIAVIG
jgi:tyrosyl-tRNA synthetase